jgi:hypothetical protein
MNKIKVFNRKNIVLSTFSLLGILITVSLYLSSCEEDRIAATPSGNITGTLEPNELTEVLVVPNSNLVNGDMPSPTNTPESPDMTMVDTTVSYTSGGQVRLPISYSGSGVSGIRFQVNGADQYFDVPVSAGNSGTMLLPIGIPSNTDEGKFCITITLYDDEGNVSNTFETCITVTKPMGCDVEKVSGGEGITSTLHDMGSNPGVVKIEYETYTVPDRIDVFYNGVWVAGTGSNPGSLGAVPPLADCSNPTEGYIGDNGSFCFEYDPSSMQIAFAKSGKLLASSLKSATGLEQSHYVEVVVSGCVRGGTAWKYDISCADPNDECMQGQEGSPRFNLQFDGGVDFDLHVIDPNGEEISYEKEYSSSGGQLDVDCICCEHGNENIYWVSGTAPKGQYQYWVEFYNVCSDNSSNFTITVTSNGNEITTKTGSLSNVGDTSQKWTYTHN